MSGYFFPGSTTGGGTMMEWIFLPFFAVNQKCSGFGRWICASRSLLKEVERRGPSSRGSKRTICPGSVDAENFPTMVPAWPGGR